MKMNQLRIAAFATILSASSLVAQQTPPEQAQLNPSQSDQSQVEQSRTASGNPGQKALDHSSLSKDQAFAKCLAISNQEQVMIARFAKEKSTNDDVKAFAATMEKAHQSCLDGLKTIATQDTKGKAAIAEGSPAIAKNSSSIDYLQMHQEMSDQCLKDSKEMLSEKEGVEFDRCFVGMQVAKHAMMHSSLTVLQRHTTGELQEFIKQGLVKNDEHMQASVNLMEQLSGKAVVKTAKSTR